MANSQVQVGAGGQSDGVKIDVMEHRGGTEKGMILYR